MFFLQDIATVCDNTCTGYAVTVRFPLTKH